jgi:3,4-dihydroxy 2-butanone 4-phosphate synthase / GTP cyclohydrolase II
MRLYNQITHTLFALHTKIAPTFVPKSMKKQVEARIPTKHGVFRMIAYAQSAAKLNPHIAFVSEGFDLAKGPVLVRIHSECITGDVFGSTRCDCGPQLTRAIEMVAKSGGILLYLRQEGRGIGLIAKLKAYNLQDKGANTLDANVHLGYAPDQRNYSVAVDILHDLGVKKLKLITNNPLKMQAMNQAGLEVIERVSIVIPPQAENIDYQRTKQELMGHLLGL